MHALVWHVIHPVSCISAPHPCDHIPQAIKLPLKAKQCIVDTGNRILIMKHLNTLRATITLSHVLGNSYYSYLTEITRYLHPQ